LNTEEEDDGTEGKANVQSSGSDVVVLHPPTTVLVTDELVEDPTNGAPREL